MLRYLTAGESHGKELTAIVEGVPSGLRLGAAYIDTELSRRQQGYGRGGRMKIETDRVEITSGVRRALTVGSPITLVVRNRDWESWVDVMAPDVAGPVETAERGRVVTRPRPGHADLTGGLKYGHRDLRNVLERSSARETAARVAAGAVCKRLLDEFGIKVYSWITGIGPVSMTQKIAHGKSPASLFEMAESSGVRCPDAAASARMMNYIDKVRKSGDSAGGVFEVAVTGVPPGLGSHVQWDRKLDGNLARALMSIQAIKGVETGLGFACATEPGSRVHDEIFYKVASSGSKKDIYWPQSPRYWRKTNNAGGIEGGMSNGETILLRAVMKPIPTLYKPLRSVDIETKKPFKASVERSDVCAVPAAAVVAESAVAFEIARSFLEKFGSDSVTELERNYRGYLRQISLF